MSKKSKGVVLDLSLPYGVGVYEDAKGKLKYQNLMQDYLELQKEADVMRSKLGAAQHRKLMLAAEVRFLRRRYRFLMELKTSNSSQEQDLVRAPTSLKHTKSTKDKHFNTKEASRHSLPQVAGPKSKKMHYVGKQVDQPRKKVLHGRKEAPGDCPAPSSTFLSDINRKGRIHIRKEIFAMNTTPDLDLEQKGRMKTGSDAAMRHSFASFDLNEDSSHCMKETSLPSRAPIFDLNEISTGDEDFPSDFEAAKLEEAKRSIIGGLNDEQQTDLKLSICRNAGEGSSRVGKRKISWQDPVALRV